MNLLLTLNSVLVIMRVTIMVIEVMATSSLVQTQDSLIVCCGQSTLFISLSGELQRHFLLIMVMIFKYHIISFK